MLFQQTWIDTFGNVCWNWKKDRERDREGERGREREEKVRERERERNIRNKRLIDEIEK